MKIEVEIRFSECDGDWEVNVLDSEKKRKSRGFRKKSLLKKRKQSNT